MAFDERLYTSSLDVGVLKNFPHPLFGFDLLNEVLGESKHLLMLLFDEVFVNREAS